MSIFNFHIILDPFDVASEKFKIFSVAEAFEAIKFYIQENRDKFFPRCFRNKFCELAKMNTSTRNEKDELKDEFKKIDIENKSRIIYIFDHILA